MLRASLVTDGEQRGGRGDEGKGEDLKEIAPG